MVTYKYPIIAREGWLIFSVVFFVAVLIWGNLGVVFSIPAWIILLALLFVYRDPARTITSAPLAIIGPVDGRIKAINEVHDPYVDREAIQIVIQMQLFSIHSIRSPTEGKVIEQWHGTKSGSERVAQPGKGNFAQWVQTDEGDDVVMVVKQNYPLFRPSCYLQSGERVGQGQRCGYVPFRAKVEVYLPANSKVEVKQGDYLVADSDVIATLVRVSQN